MIKQIGKLQRSRWNHETDTNNTSEESETGAHLWRIIVDDVVFQDSRREGQDMKDGAREG